MLRQFRVASAPHVCASATDDGERCLVAEGERLHLLGDLRWRQRLELLLELPHPSERFARRRGQQQNGFVSQHIPHTSVRPDKRSAPHNSIEASRRASWLCFLRNWTSGRSTSLKSHTRIPFFANISSHDPQVRSEQACGQEHNRAGESVAESATPASPWSSACRSLRSRG
eukprot:5167637-Prymnesium_polylepis.2